MPIIKAYTYLQANPQVGINASITAYVMSVLSTLMTDASVKTASNIAVYAGLFVALATAISMVVKGVVWCIGIYRKIRSSKN